MAGREDGMVKLWYNNNGLSVKQIVEYELCTNQKQVSAGEQSQLSVSVQFYILPPGAL